MPENSNRRDRWDSQEETLLLYIRLQDPEVSRNELTDDFNRRMRSNRTREAICSKLRSLKRKKWMEEVEAEKKRKKSEEAETEMKMEKIRIMMREKNEKGKEGELDVTDTDRMPSSESSQSPKNISADVGNHSSSPSLVQGQSEGLGQLFETSVWIETEVRHMYERSKLMRMNLESLL